MPRLRGWCKRLRSNSAFNRAQEHARFARERAELARLKAELDRNTTETGTEMNDAACRVQALREHLKDIHQEESQERESRKLTSRLARLWKRLDGN